MARLEGSQAQRTEHAAAPSARPVRAPSVSCAHAHSVCIVPLLPVIAGRAAAEREARRGHSAVPGRGARRSPGGGVGGVGARPPQPSPGSEVRRALPLCTLPRVECHRLTCHRDAAGDGIDRVCRQPGPRGTEPLLAVPGPRVAPCTPASGRCARMNMYRGRRALTTLQGQCLRSLHPFLPSTFTKPQRALHGTTLLSPKTAERTLSKSPPAGPPLVCKRVRKNSQGSREHSRRTLKPARHLTKMDRILRPAKCPPQRRCPLHAWGEDHG